MDRPGSEWNSNSFCWMGWKHSSFFTLSTCQEKGDVSREKRVSSNHDAVLKTRESYASPSLACLTRTHQFPFLSCFFPLLFLFLSFSITENGRSSHRHLFYLVNESFFKKWLFQFFSAHFSTDALFLMSDLDNIQHGDEHFAISYRCNRSNAHLLTLMTCFRRCH